MSTTQSRTIGVLSYDPDKLTGWTKHSVGMRASDRRYIERLGYEVVPITQDSKWDPKVGPVVMACGKAQEALLWMFLQTNPQITRRDELDLIQMRTGTGWTRELEVNADYLRYNAFYSKGDVRDLQVIKELMQLFDCPHRPSVVARIMEIDPYVLRVNASAVLGASVIQRGGTVVYTGELFPELMRRLCIHVCPGCLPTASRMIFAAMAKVFDYTDISIKDVWEADMERVRQARIPAPTRGRSRASVHSYGGWM